MPSYLLEACVETVTQAIWAQSAGADQIELCDRLDLDGLTPEETLVRNVHRCVDIPIKVMIRPHNHGFYYTGEEKQAMKEVITRNWGLGMRQFVVGAITPDGSLDRDLITGLLDAFPGILLTIHKAIDLCTDPLHEIEWLSSRQGVTHVLTSGARPNAMQGAGMIRRMQQVAGDRLIIIAAGGITWSNLEHIHGMVGAQIYHGRRIVRGLL